MTAIQGRYREQIKHRQHYGEEGCYAPENLPIPGIGKNLAYCNKAANRFVGLCLRGKDKLKFLPIVLYGYNSPLYAGRKCAKEGVVAAGGLVEVRHIVVYNYPYAPQRIYAKRHIEQLIASCNSSHNAVVLKGLQALHNLHKHTRTGVVNRNNAVSLHKSRCCIRRLLRHLCNCKWNAILKESPAL